MNWSMKPYRMQCYVSALENAGRINTELLAGYQALRDDPVLKRSHYFEGRYENIYIERSRLPAIEPVLQAALAAAADYLQQDATGLSVGFWFNEMGPGHRTLPHRHDDDDEQASAVYYVQVPEQSGELVLRRGMIVTQVTPVEGTFVFFAPDIEHEVTENLSQQPRLSIGMNFGRRG